MQSQSASWDDRWPFTLTLVPEVFFPLSAKPSRRSKVRGSHLSNWEIEKRKPPGPGWLTFLLAYRTGVFAGPNRTRYATAHKLVSCNFTGVRWSWPSIFILFCENVFRFLRSMTNLHCFLFGNRKIQGPMSIYPSRQGPLRSHSNTSSTSPRPHVAPILWANCCLVKSLSSRAPPKEGKVRDEPGKCTGSLFSAFPPPLPWDVVNPLMRDTRWASRLHRSQIAELPGRITIKQGWYY